MSAPDAITRSDSTAHAVGCADLFSEVRPGGLLGRCLDAISNPRKHRWNAYLRACESIPKESPVYGTTSFDRINGRRHDLIEAMFADNKARYVEIKSSAEYLAVSRATSEWLCGPTVASNFLLGRLLRRLRVQHPENADVLAPAGEKTLTKP